MEKGFLNSHHTSRCTMFYVTQTPKKMYNYVLLQATVEKQNKCLLNDIADANHRHEELQSAIGDADVTKKKLAAEKTDLDKQIADADATVRSLGKLRTSLSTQV